MRQHHARMIILVILLFCSSSFAATNGYHFKIDLSVGQKIISSPDVIVLEGETATIVQKNGDEKYFIQILATEKAIQNHRGILMNFTIGLIEENGQRTVRSKPTLLARENTAVQIVSGVDNDEESLALSVIARRTNIQPSED